MKFKKLIIALFAIAPMIIGGCSRKPASSSEKEPTSSQEPGHVHSFDEFGICSCGEIQEKEGIEFVTAGDESAHQHLGGKVAAQFKLKGYAGHGITIGIAYNFNKTTAKLKWVEGKTVKTNDIGAGEFTPEVTGIYYLHIETDESCTEEKECYIKYAYKVGAEHHYNDLGMCECGNATGFKSMAVDIAVNEFNSEVGTVHRYAIQMFKDHKYVARSVSSFPGELVEIYHFEKNPGEWVKEAFDNNGLSVFNNNAFYVAKASAIHFIVFTATHVTTNATFKLTIDESSHQYEEWGECPCGKFRGETINTSEDGTTKYNVSDLAVGEKRYFRWKVTNTNYNNMYIGGDYIAVKHTAGLFVNGEKIAANGYNRTITDIVYNKYYYLIVTRPDNQELNANAAVWIRAKQNLNV